MKIFYDYLNRIRPLINTVALEKAAMIPKNSLGKHFRWADGKAGGQLLSTDHIPAILRAICSTIGQPEINGWRIMAMPEELAIVAIKPIPNRSPKVLEVGQGFEYLQPEWRVLYDYFDFATYFE